MSSTVLVFDPQGTPHDVPYEKMHEALSNGGTPGVRMTGDDGQVHSVPATKINDAYQHGGKLLPLETQETEHPGFWHAVGSYFANPDSGKLQTEADLWKKRAESPGVTLPTPEENAQRKAAGLGPTYRALVPVAESLGMNVKGAEQAAKEGDVGGVAGYAAVPAAAAIAPLALEGAGSAAAKLAGKVGPAAKSAVGSAVRTASDIVDPDITGIVSPRLAHVQRALGRLAKTMDSTGEAPVYRDATIDKLNIPDYAGEAPSPGSTEELRDFWQQRGGGLTNKPVDRATMQGGPQIGQKQALLRQAEALKQPVQDIVDAAIPPTGETKASNLLTKSRIEFQLQRGNVEAAQQILESAKPKPVTSLPSAKPSPGEAPTGGILNMNDKVPTDAMAIINRRFWQTTGMEIPEHLWDDMTVSDLQHGANQVDEQVLKESASALYKAGYRQFGDYAVTDDGLKQSIVEGKIAPAKLTSGPVKGEPRIVPSVQNIRENDAMVRDAESQPNRIPQPGSKADKLEDRAYSQEMNWDLERKGWQAESEARREFIARNSTGATKGSLIEQARQGAGQKAEAPASSDLTEILLKSLEQAKNRKR